MHSRECIQRATLSPPRSQVAKRGKHGERGLNAMFADIAKKFGKRTQPKIYEFQAWWRRVVAFEETYGCRFMVA